jgi:hypothetical protein
MKTIILTLSLILLIYGCDNNKKSTTTSLEEERQKNISIVNASPVETTSQPSIPKFILACSTGTGQPWYRIASNGTNIYFASIVNENNLRAAKKSYEIEITEREIKAKTRSGEGGKTDFIEIDRSTLFASTWYFVSKQSYPPDGIVKMGLNCTEIEDDQLLTTLNNAYNATLSETLENKKQHDNRPNKI